MRGKAVFLAGVAIGYVLGAKAGRERYEQIMRAARTVRANPTVQEAAGLMQAQTVKLVNSGKGVMRDKVGPRLGESRLSHTRIGQRLLGDHAKATASDNARRNRHST
ncbi:MAG: hypothetical protein ACRDT8_11890 [Micromonosporaceae bacterium]